MKRLWPAILCFWPFVLLHGQSTIDIPFIVDDGGKTAISLNASDLKVEAKHEVVTVASVKPLAGQHLQYVLVNKENEESLWPGGTPQQVEVAKQFLAQSITSDDVGGLVNFDQEYYLDVRNEKTAQKVSASLSSKCASRLAHVPCFSAMFDALTATADYLASQPSQPDHRKVIFLFSDGVDNASQLGMEVTIERLQEASIPVFAVAPSSAKNEVQGKGLTKLTRETGGRVYFLPKDTQQVSFEALGRDLARSFLLRISISSSEGRKIPLRITATSNQKTSIIAPSHIVIPRFKDAPVSKENSESKLSGNRPSSKQLAELRSKCAPFADHKIEEVQAGRVPLPPRECSAVLGWMRDPRIQSLYQSQSPPH